MKDNSVNRYRAGSNPIDIYDREAIRYMTYFPTWQSLQQHKVPAWFHNAKLGVMIHWTPASVPAWAPINGNLYDLINNQGAEYYFTHNPYAEWYYNTIRIKDSPSHHYHVTTYGSDFSYFDFAPIFNRAIEKWDPTNWSSLFQQAGMKYVVFVAKHHDGFLLWPSRRPNPYHRNYQTTRDVVGELTNAVEQQGMKMGLYYSGGLDWTFNDSIIRDIPSLYRSVAQTPEFAAYVDAHWRELIDCYAPKVLWGDIGYPHGANLTQLFAYYYNNIPEGVVNDRFAQELPVQLDTSNAITSPTNKHFDFITPEYSSFSTIRQTKWECTRGLGYSYGYNMNETVETHLSSTELVHLLADVVSKNGNLLLGVASMSDGTIPAIQRQLLEALGRWLEINGEAIFDTHCWITAEATTKDGIPIRFTQTSDSVYAIVLGRLEHRMIIVEALTIKEEAAIYLLGHAEALQWHQQDNNLIVSLPHSQHFDNSPAYTLKIVSHNISFGRDQGSVF